MVKVNTGGVDLALDNIDYEWKDYVPTLDSLKFTTFIQEVNNGEGEEDKTPIVHTAMMEKVFNRKIKSLVLCHRGLGKTTVFAEYLFMHIAAFGYMPGFGKITLALYISDSVENGVKNLRRNIEHRYLNSEMMQKMIPNRKIMVGVGDADGNPTGHASIDVTSDADYAENFEKQINAGKKFTDIRMEFQNHKGHTFVIKGYGAAQGVRGSKELGVRPQLAVFDDILSDTDATSPTIIATIENTVYKAVSKALDPKKQKQIWLGTPFNQSDPIYKAAESGVWELACYPIAQDFDATTTRETFKGSWEERFGYDYVKREFDDAIALGRPDDFYQELMLRISNADDRLIQDKDIRQFNRNAKIHDKSGMNFYITTDAATTDSSTADFSVIMVWGIDKDKNYYLMDFWFGKVLLSGFINALFDMVKLWSHNLLGVGIEVSGQQGGTISTIKDKMVRDDVFFFLLSYGNSNLEGIRPAQGTRKYERFQVMQPRFSTGKMWFPDDLDEDPFMVEMYNEIRYVGRTNTGKKIGKAKNDDILDCIAMLSMIEVIPPSFDEDENEDRGKTKIGKSELNDPIFGNMRELHKLASNYRDESELTAYSSYGG